MHTLPSTFRGTISDRIVGDLSKSKKHQDRLDSGEWIVKKLSTISGVNWVEYGRPQGHSYEGNGSNIDGRILDGMNSDLTTEGKGLHFIRGTCYDLKADLLTKKEQVIDYLYPFLFGYDRRDK